MNARDLLYIGRRRALELGFTHEGTLFGVPAWMIDVSAEQVTACPKVPALQALTLLGDSLLELASHFMREDQVLHTPISVKRRIRLDTPDDLDPARGVLYACAISIGFYALMYGFHLLAG